MEKETTTPKKEKNPQIETIRGEKVKAIGAHIFLGQSSDGNQSHYFTLSRAWKRAGAKKFNYSERFYPQYAQAVAEVALKAAERCKELDAALEPEDFIEEAA